MRRRRKDSCAGAGCRRKNRRPAENPGFGRPQAENRLRAPRCRILHSGGKIFTPRTSGVKIHIEVEFSVFRGRQVQDPLPRADRISVIGIEKHLAGRRPVENRSRRPRTQPGRKTSRTAGAEKAFPARVSRWRNGAYYPRDVCTDLVRPYFRRLAGPLIKGKNANDFRW